MSTTTEYLGLIKPELTDLASLDDLNSNMDLIDEKIKTMDENGTVIEDGSITTSKLSDSSVTEEKLGEGSVSESKLSNSSVTNDKILDKTIDILTKLDAELVNYTSDLIANTEDGVPHSLNRVPIGYLVVGLDKPTVVFKGVSAWNSTHIFLQCDKPSVSVSVLVF